MKRKPYGFIYIITNKINGKRYIGQRKFSNNHGGWKNYLGSGTLLKRAIIKYGEDNFYRDIVDLAYSAEELDEKECEWIKNYNAINSEDFYNILKGGRVTIGAINRIGTKIVCIKTGIIFNSINQLKFNYNISDTDIKNNMFKCLSKKIHTHLFKTKNKKSFAFIKYVDLKKRKNNYLVYCPKCKKEFCNYIGEETVCDICRNKKLCVQCNRLINKTSNSRKYCKECAKEIKRGQDRISDRIYKQKLKSEKCKNS